MPSPSPRPTGDLTNADVVRAVDMDLYKLAVVCMVATAIAFGVVWALFQPQITANAQEIQRREVLGVAQDERLRAVEEGVNRISTVQATQGVAIRNVEKDINNITKLLERMDTKLDRAAEKLYSSGGRNGTD